MADKYEVRLLVINHIAKMLLEMSQIDFDDLSPADEAEMLENYQDIAVHLLDSLGFDAGDSADGAAFTADFLIQDPEEYIRKKLAEEDFPNP